MFLRAELDRPARRPSSRPTADRNWGPFTPRLEMAIGRPGLSSFLSDLTAITEWIRTRRYEPSDADINQTLTCNEGLPSGSDGHLGTGTGTVVARKARAQTEVDEPQWHLGRDSFTGESATAPRWLPQL